MTSTKHYQPRERKQLSGFSVIKRPRLAVESPPPSPKKLRVIGASGDSPAKIVNSLKQAAVSRSRQFRLQKISSSRNIKHFVIRLEEREMEVTALRGAVERLTTRIEEQDAQLRALTEQQSALLQVVRDIPPQPSLNEAAAEQEWQARVSAGESARQAWVQNGLLVPSSELALAWGRTPQALSLASGRGELLSLKVKRNRYYPAVFKRLSADDVKEICLRLKGDDEAGQFIFWNRQHGSLEGLAPTDAIIAGKRDKVAQLAEAWSEEHGYLS